MEKTGKRYLAQARAISPEDQARLAAFPLTIVGCGGLGGAIAEQVVRLGFLKISLWDDDVFSASNLNRQRFSTLADLGKPKVDVVARALKAIDDRVDLTLHQARMTSASGPDMAGTHLLLDGLDSGQARLDLEKVAQDLGIPLVHGALGGTLGQVGFFYPHHQAMARLYKDRPPVEASVNFPMTVNIVSGLQVAQALAYALGQEPGLSGRLALIDIGDPSLHTIDFSTTSSP